jgi:hydrogenase nickel incorporation protein HypA/HybF
VFAVHELSIALSILDVAAEEAERRGLTRVAAIHMKLGGLSGVVKGALESAFELASAGHPLAGARLEIEEVAIVARCPRCMADCQVVSVQEIVCSLCGTPTPEIISGRELEVTALEVAS